MSTYLHDLKKQHDQTSSIVDSIVNKKTPRQIAELYSIATVYIEVSWKLIDTYSGKQLYLRYKTENKDGTQICTPCYLQMQDGTVEPWLITKDEENSNEPIGKTHTGSGFVVTENGFIVTNRHVVATWLSRYLCPLPGYIYRQDRVNRNGPIPKKTNVIDRYEGNLEKWVPAKSIQFGGRDYRAKRIEGHLDTLNVTFPKNTSRISATLECISNKHDVALIAIKTAQPIRKVELFDNPKKIRPGDPITIMGYPNVSPETVTATKSHDPFNEYPDIVTVPDPTVTPAIISKVFPGNETQVTDEKNLAYYSEISDSYQLTATATGEGNSGGPVFDEYGRVIGIFYAGKQKQLRDARVTFALPIKYAMELLTVNKPVFE